MIDGSVTMTIISSAASNNPADSGRDMKETHAAFAIDKADFNALVEDLQIAMDRRDIPFRAQNKLLSVLAPMHREVITR